MQQEGGTQESMQEKVEEEAMAELQGILRQKEEMKVHQVKQPAGGAVKEDDGISWGMGKFWEGTILHLGCT